LWIDSGCTTHVSNIMYEFLSTRTINPNEMFVFIDNKDKVPVKAVGTYRLIFDTKYPLDLINTFYVLHIIKNLFSLSKLNVVGYPFKFENGRCSLSLF